jgi:hypothetical protein
MSHRLVEAPVTTDFVWDYAQMRPQLTRLYEKGKASQWNATTDIDWSPEIHFGAPLEPAGADRGGGLLLGEPSPESPFRKLTDEERTRLRWELQAWMVSQFPHGEQGALVATARLVETVPDVDSKYYAANQVADEARHVEAYARYLDEKLGHSYPISAPLESLLVDIMTERRWDITYLGMQIMVEGLALAAFGLGSTIFHDPVIKQITDYVMRDEARHVAFGVLSLQGLYPAMTSAELADREEFLLEATSLMHERFLLDQVWERMDIDVEAGKQFARQSTIMQGFRQMLFSKIVPNLRKLGLLTPRLRDHYGKLGILHFQEAPDPTSEVGPGLVG